MYLNKEEILTGLAHSACWAFFQGWYAIPAALISGFLWAFGGAAETSKNWRRIGCPIIICLPILFKYPWVALSGFLLHIILRLGYGIPTYLPDGTCLDNGSDLGRLWWKICGGKEVPDKSIERIATIGVRTTLALLAALAFMPLAWLSLIPYLIGGLLLTFLVPIIVDKT